MLQGDGSEADAGLRSFPRLDRGSRARPARPGDARLAQVSVRHKVRSPCEAAGRRNEAGYVSGNRAAGHQHRGISEEVAHLASRAGALIVALDTETRPAQPTPPEERRPRGPSTGYLFKRLLLGKPLATARLEHERLSKTVAMAVFSSDNMSSVAYATEEILRVLVPAVGLAAFSLVLPLSAVIVLVEVILIFSYRQTIKAYPTAGGAYIVTKDNLGLLPAQLAGVALLVDYVLTVSVSTAAGVQAISSVVPLSVVMRIVLSLFFVWLIAYGNLLGVRESGRIFATPTYLFIFSLGLTCAMGLYQVVLGHLRPFPIHHQVAAGGLSPGVAAVG